ncbi:MAG: hopanoid biosynthesis-associated protein HpnK [Verrucomicrobia bacterium]|nr:hopanoid biosynthesis-associated protein HpnK [Verrucomicrobiota bacterium]
MATGEASKRRLIVNADDFGRSGSINASVIQAHREGILTTASLMVNEPSCDEAVRLAKANPRLGVGLHLSLLCGKAGLSPDRIPGLADAQGRFTESPVAAGVRYFFLPALRSQLRAEIRQQLVVFRETGLPLDHVNGHLHLHLHPTIHNILLELAAEFQIRHVRLTRDPLRLNLALSRGHMFYRFSHALIFGLLSQRARGRMDALGIRYTERVFGLLQNARVTRDYVLKLLQAMPPGDSELYSHPSLDEFRAEHEALTSPEVARLVSTTGIQLIRYQDL